MAHHREAASLSDSRSVRVVVFALLLVAASACPAAASPAVIRGEIDRGAVETGTDPDATGRHECR
jgi:hypothetical protein